MSTPNSPSTSSPSLSSPTRLYIRKPLSIVDYFKTNNINCFEDFVKCDLVEKNYVKYKQGRGEFEDLYIVTVNDSLDLNLVVSQDKALTIRDLRRNNGIIINKFDNSVICCGFSKPIKVEDKERESLLNCLDSSNEILNIDKSVDGTLIKMYFYNGKWRLSTTNTIDARNSYWSSGISFEDLFYDAYYPSESFKSKLVEDYSYFMILRHPKERNIIGARKPLVILVCAKSRTSLKEQVIDNFIHPGDITPEEIIAETNEKSFDNIQMKYKYNLMNREDFNSFRGYIVTTKDGDRYLYDNKIYSEIEKVKGNAADIPLKFIELIQQNDRKGILLFYFFYSDLNLPALKQGFENLVAFLQNEYYKYYVTQNGGLKSKYSRTLYQLHSRYLKRREKTTRAVVKDHLKQLSPYIVAYLMGVVPEPKGPKPPTNPVVDAPHPPEAPRAPYPPEAPRAPLVSTRIPIPNSSIIEALMKPPQVSPELKTQVDTPHLYL